MNKNFYIKNISDLRETIIRLRREQFKLNLLKTSEGFNKFHLFKEKKKNIARINTFIRKNKDYFNV